jgi:hypothetical protein
MPPAAAAAAAAVVVSAGVWESCRSCEPVLLLLLLPSFVTVNMTRLPLLSVNSSPAASCVHCRARQVAGMWYLCRTTAAELGW